MKLVKHFWPSILLLGVLYLFNKPLGPLPAIGNFFSPFTGFAQNMESSLIKKDSFDPAISGLKEEVNVIYDDNAVPHIFAKNEDDLYLTQGYVMAKDRIWQMEFYTMAAAGRVSELVGPRGLPFDQYHRGLGMAKTAQDMAKNLKTGSLEDKVLSAYTAGVNAYLSSISYKNLPIEYKIMGYEPEPWTKEKTMLMLMNMRNVLNGGTTDMHMSNIAAKYGMDAVSELFTDYPLSESPIIPVGTPWNFSKVNIPDASNKRAVQSTQTALKTNIPLPQHGIGSNNWAVHGSKSATGLPILANDPHLNLTLPSIWYQMQLSCPGLNVYGVALPGCPGIVIGFNKDIAWGVTNVGSDVMDFYNIKFKDKTKTEYFHDNVWKKVSPRQEIYKIKGAPAVVDTVLYTHHGPIIYETDLASNFTKQVPVGHAMKWIGHETNSTDLLGFYYLNKAKTYDDYRKALTYYIAPAQNFIFASNQNDISITPNGRLPLKRKNQGKFILDGSQASDDWQGWIPTDQNPTVKNPPRGFVSSANQHSVDQTYPYYLGWRFAPPFRAIRINERLSKMKNVTADSLRMLQNDNHNVPARRILPTLLKTLETAQVKGPELDVLKKWNYDNSASSVGASIFELWSDLLQEEIWDDEFTRENNMIYPTDERTYDIIEKSPTAKWFDNVSTKNKVETLSDVIVNSYKKTLDSLVKSQGPFNTETWQWSKVKNSEVNHLVSLFKSFSRKNINTGGGGNMVNAHTKLTGPSWRMVVELDKNWPKAFGLYPGGQSGNPGSKYYDNMLDTWAEGKLNPLPFMKSETDPVAKVAQKLIFKPKK